MRISDWSSDVCSSDLLNRAIGDLKAMGTTVVVIGHRLSTFAAADKLLVLVEGAVQHWGGRSEVLDKITRRKFHSVPTAPVPPGREPASGRPTEGAAGQGVRRGRRDGGGGKRVR